MKDLFSRFLFEAVMMYFFYQRTITESSKLSSCHARQDKQDEGLHKITDISSIHSDDVGANAILPMGNIRHLLLSACGSNAGPQNKNDKKISLLMMILRMELKLGV